MRRGISSRITIKNLTKRRIPAASSIKRTVKRVLELEKTPAFGLSVTYVSDARIRRLNKEFRKRDYATDVLAFSMTEGRRLKGEESFLGDIVISVDAAERHARRFRSTKERELKLYLIHGILHLLGYDGGGDTSHYAGGGDTSHCVGGGDTSHYIKILRGKCPRMKRISIEKRQEELFNKV